MKQTITKGNPVVGVLVLCFLGASTLICFSPVFVIGLAKLFPNLRWRVLCTDWIDKVASTWISLNNFYINKIIKPRIEVTGLGHLNQKNWYLVIANHQSSLDIAVLQHIFNRQIPTFKFFIKDALKWVPLFGFTWWAMGCTFMKRYSREHLQKNPHKQGKDIATTQKSLKIFSLTPTTIMNFIEGTRLTPNKHREQQPPYKHLLKPKAGGISYVIATLGEKIDYILDVSIVYPQKKHTLWDFVCQRVQHIKVHVREIMIPEQFKQAELMTCTQNQSQFRNWLNERWAEKDAIIAEILQKQPFLQAK